MAFKPIKKGQQEMKDVRFQLPLDVFNAVERWSQRDGMEPADLLRQAISYVMKPELRKIRAEARALKVSRKGQAPVPEMAGGNV
ncbi:hypothetical protein [Geothrix sp. PMB-07]|uniref:hypothetical protein n=1 Tax=Geothrix sp. PMB-07 TaxID=3068640 RepID=UPI002741B5FE|nr:hypothetical protein [Geothrix sp. PMB-07]WLT33345.1 hypothetical protein Q9293_08400 [Geothrix sp. PMB-07]